MTSLPIIFSRIEHPSEIELFDFADKSFVVPVIRDGGYRLNKHVIAVVRVTDGAVLGCELDPLDDANIEARLRELVTRITVLQIQDAPSTTLTMI